MKLLGVILVVTLLVGISGILSMPGVVYAQCPPTTSGNDTLVNNNNCSSGQAWDGLEGDDDLTNAAGSGMGYLRGGDGNDTLTNNGTINNADINGGAGNDTIVNNGAVGENIYGMDGQDTIVNAAGATVGGDINGGNQSDTITNNGAVGGSILGGGDDIDWIENNGTVGGDIVGSTMLDHITNNGTVIGRINGGLGHDFITNNGTAGSIVGGDGIDRIRNTSTGIVIGNITSEYYSDIIINDGYVGGNIDGGDFADTITNNGTVVGTILGGSGAFADVITNTGTAGNINGGDGDDIITNSGTVTDMLLGGAGNDTITNTGAINGLLNAGAGNDTIDTSGPTGHLLGDDGDDTFTLRDGATVAGVLIGGNGYDILRFAFTVYSNDYPGIASAIAGANPLGGSLIINGNTYEWIAFEQLVDLLNVLQSPPPDPTEEPTEEPTQEPTEEPTQEPGGGEEPVIVIVQFRIQPTLNDGRINIWDTAAPAALYCAVDANGARTGGVSAYSVIPTGGDFAFLADENVILAKLAQAVLTGRNILIAERLDVSLWALSTGELQAIGRDGYTFIFSPAVCGIGG